MKRLFAFVVCFIFVGLFVFSGCGDDTRDGELREFLSLNENSYDEVFTSEECGFSDLTQYMQTWAKANSVEIVYQGDHSIVLQNEASKGYSDEPECIMLCSFDPADAPSCKDVIATGQTALLGPSDHGQISLAIAEYTDGQYLGIEELPEKYLAGDSLINLTTSSSNNILTSGPIAADCNFHYSASKTKSTYKQAFEIKMSMPEYTDPYDFAKGRNFPNPIDTIGSFLASNKSAGKLFDIASFTSESHEGCTPYSASAVVVVDGNHIESFNSRFEKSYDNMKDKFEELEAPFEYTIEETDMPDKVLSDEAADNIISLMYTLTTGVCQQDEDSGLIYAASYFKSISTDKGDLDLKLGIRARGESYMDALSSEYETTAGLCSSEYSIDKAGRLWNSDTKSSLVKYFTGCVPQQDQAESAISLRSYENDLIAQKLSDQNMIIYTFEKGDRKTVLSNIINFLDPSVQK